FCARGLLVRSYLPSCSFAQEITFSAVKPNSSWRTLRGAEAPNVFMPTMAPVKPVYRAHPKVDAGSTATRAVMDGGSTLSRYSLLCSSKSSQEGMLTTRDLMP